MNQTPIEILRAGADCLWVWNQIHLASTTDQLTQVSVDIGNDKFEGEAYTKDEKAMGILREAYSKKRVQCSRK